MSGVVAWTGAIVPTAAQTTLNLVDIVAGVMSDDVIVADTSDNGGIATFEQHRWSSAGAVVSSHTDSAATATGTYTALSTSGLFADGSNGVFYGMLLTGGTGGAMDLLWNRLSPSGTVDFSASIPGTASPAPAVTFLQVGGDASANVHGAFLLAGSQTNLPIGQGVYCYDYAGDAEGASATNLTSTLTSKDFLWPTPDNGLALFQHLTAPVNPGCGNLAVTAAGGWVLGKFTGAGGCTWTTLLALPTAAVQAWNFRVGADGSLNAMVVYSGTINFGGGALTSSGTNSLAIAQFSSAGTLQWTHNFGGTGSSFTIGSLSVNAASTMIVTGGYKGTVNLGGGALPASSDTFLAVFNSAGTLQWSKTVTVGGQGGLKAASGPCGLVLATNSPNVNLGTGALSVATAGMPATIGVAALGL